MSDRAISNSLFLVKMMMSSLTPTTHAHEPPLSAHSKHATWMGLVHCTRTRLAPEDER
jgi:hypothetical protein